MIEEYRFRLFINDIPSGNYPTLDQAQSDAIPSIEKGKSVRIEYRFPLVPNKIWIYDKQENDWVEQL